MTILNIQDPWNPLFPHGVQQWTIQYYKTLKNKTSHELITNKASKLEEKHTLDDKGVP